MRHLTHLCLIRNCIRSVPFSEKADPEEEKERLLNLGMLKMTLPDKPQSHSQKYMTVQGAVPKN